MHYRGASQSIRRGTLDYASRGLVGTRSIKYSNPVLPAAAWAFDLPY